MRGVGRVKKSRCHVPSIIRFTEFKTYGTNEIDQSINKLGMVPVVLNLKGLSHEMDLAFDDIYGLFKA